MDLWKFGIEELLSIGYVTSPIIHNIGASNLENLAQGCLEADIHAALSWPTLIGTADLP